MEKIIKIVTLLFALTATTNAVVFNCVELKEYYWPVLGTYYSCYNAVAVSNLENPIVTEITGIHMANRANVDVRGFYILSHKNLTYIPQGLEHFFPNMIAYAIGHGSGVKNISSCDLKGYGKLQLIALGGNNIDSVPGDFLKYTPEVVVFHIHYNQIKYFGSEIFPALQKLKSADFTFNQCVNKSASNNAQMPGIIETLRSNCTDITVQQNTKTCGTECSAVNLAGRVCRLEERNTYLEAEYIRMNQMLYEAYTKVLQIEMKLLLSQSVPVYN